VPYPNSFPGDKKKKKKIYSDNHSILCLAYAL